MQLARHILVFLALGSFCYAAEDWPQWRGAHRTGVADPDQEPPVEFSATSDNVKWVAPIPGRGHGSPMVFGNKVFLAIADAEADTQSLMCLDRATGKPL